MYNYEELGFKCGLEIHQRLKSKGKLFCSCDSSISNDMEIGEVFRYQRAVAGELGSVDIAAEVESEKRSRYIYKIYDRSTCLVDIDEEPPHQINQEALMTALIIAKSLNMHIVDEIQVMRKMVLDGSDPTSFQRSALIGLDGYIKLNSKEMGISSAFLEEESAGILEKKENAVIYSTQRLGVPLIEIDTDPTIANPTEARDLAMRIGILLRLTNRVQRGIGSIRQDVNVSIKDGNRVEIKGFQQIEDIDKFIENEVTRQKRLIEIRDELSSRRASVKEIIDVTSVFKDTKSKIIRSAIDNNGLVLAFGLEGFKGLLGREVNPDRRLGSEISDYAKLAGLNGIIHSDEDLNRYMISESEIKELISRLGISKDDSFIIVAGDPGKVKNAAKLAKMRAELAIKQVPKETRAVLDQKRFTTKVLRPLPGSSRMYPETDIKPIRTVYILKEIEDQRVDIDKVESDLYKELGNKELINNLIRSRYFYIYQEISSALDIRAKQALAIILTQVFNELRLSEDIDEEGINRIKSSIELYQQNKITRKALFELVKYAISSSEPLELIIKDKRLYKLSIEDLRREIASLNASSPDILKRGLLKRYPLNIDIEELDKVIKEIS
ncbi:MAG: glutamyl-tRNA(Gln) amidotransferase subunit E [Candidatus Micrarchaeota archaeon]|nr:MAG: glutamyl-tRNA(Gln) amidotransferase subunit E [Candidatus Micrarchaeota archaeon]